MQEFIYKNGKEGSQVNTVFYENVYNGNRATVQMDPAVHSEDKGKIVKPEKSLS